jgi:signal recognition particle subunit SEC65
MKRIDLRQSVQKLCNQYPELVDIMRQLGFEEITKPGMLATAGRFMTIPKGAAMRRISMDTIRQALTDNGFEIMEGEGEK